MSQLDEWLRRGTQVVNDKQYIGSEPEAALDSEVAKQNFGVIEYSEDLVHSHSMPTERTISQESDLCLDRFVGVTDTGTDPPTSEPSVTHTPPQTYAHAHTEQRTSGRQDKERDELTYADGPVGVCDSLGVVNGCASVEGLSVQLPRLPSTQSGDTGTSSSVTGMTRPLSQSVGDLVGFKVGKKPNSGRTSAHLDNSPMLSKTEYASTGAIPLCADALANEMSISKYRRFFSLNGMSSQSPPSPICGNSKFGPFGSGGGVASPDPGLKQQVLQFVAATAQCATLWTDALALGIGLAMSDAYGNHHLYINTFEDTARCSVCVKLIKGSFHQGFGCTTRECDIRAHAECRVLLPPCVATETAEQGNRTCDV